MKVNRRVILMICGFSVVLMTSCGDGGGGGVSVGSKDGPPAQPGEAPPEMMNVTIHIPPGAAQKTRDAFGENPLTITVGTRVTWVNDDVLTHTATSDTGVWDTGNIPPRGSASFQFTTAGTFPYHCTPHPAMKGAIQAMTPVTHNAPTVPAPPSTHSPHG